MRAEGIAESLGELLTLACALYDLFTIAGVPVRREVAARIVTGA